MAATAPGQRLQARHQFEEGERFAEVIVGAVAQAPDPVFNPLAGGEHDHRRLLARTQRAQHTEAIKARQHHVEDDHRVVAFQRQVQALDAVAGQIHV